MPATEIVIYRDEKGRSPFLEWMDSLPAKAQDKCLVRIERLAEMGHELRRPEADYLTDGIYELRATYRSVQYRILYFFHKSIGVLVHGLTKESAVPRGEIELAIDRREKYRNNPEKHTLGESR